MKRFLCILVALSILSLNTLVFAEDTTTNCTCCNCQNQGEQTEGDSDTIPGLTDGMTQEEIYEAWLTASWSLLYSRYAESTWFHFFYKDGQYIPCSFILLDNILMASDEEIGNVDLAISGYDSEDSLKEISKTYSFVKNMPSTAETIKSTRSLFGNNVPDGYEAIDNLLMDAVNELAAWRDSIPIHMAEHNGNLEDFSTKVPEDTKKKIDILNYLFTIRG